MSRSALPRLAVMVSGRGRNLQALHTACADGRIPATIAGVVSSRTNAAALIYAREAGLRSICVAAGGIERSAYDAALIDALQSLQPDIIAMAGFMRIVGDGFIEAFRGRLLNIHPSLLPKYPGLHTHRRALEAGDVEHGATVHFVTEALDGGPRVIQASVPVRPDDDETTLAARVLDDVELKLFPQVMAWMARGELCQRDDVAMFRGAVLSSPLTADALESAFR